MRSRRILPAVSLLLAVGCGGASGSKLGAGGISGKADAGSASGAGGTIYVSLADAGLPARDAGKMDSTAPNVFADAPAFNWDSPPCPGCGGAGIDAGGQPSLDGAIGAGGMTGTGGSSSGGGASGLDAPVIYVDSGPGSVDVAGGSDARVDIRSDGPAADSATTADALSAGCTAEIVPVLPAVLADDQKLVAAPNMKIVLRARVRSGTAPAGTPWQWRATVNGALLPVAETSAQDPDAAAFRVEDDGDYVFTAVAGTCVAAFSRAARGPEGCPACDYGADIQVAPPPSAALPAQGGFYAYSQSINLAAARTVKLFAKVSLGLVPAYLRINHPDGTLVTDGYGDPTVGFVRPLLVRDAQKDFARYQILVVPMDGSGDGRVGSTAPQLFVERTEADLEASPVLTIAGGLAVTGTALGATGQGIADVRVILSNQNPAAPAPANLVFSSVGYSNAQGSYTLAAQPGLYWVSFSPPPESGLAEALSTSPIDLRDVASLGFQWSAPAVASLDLQVVDASGNAAANVRVLVNSTQAAPAGVLTFQPAGGQPVSQSANGDVHLEATSGKTGQVSFPALPANAAYDVLLVPPTLGPLAATTALSLTVPAAGLSQRVALAFEGTIAGQLAAQGSPDWSEVRVVAFDKSQTVPEPPRAAAVNANGSFALGVSPGRAYAVLAWPDPGTGLARTFIGPGLLQASAFSITQKVQSGVDWSGTVTVENQSGGIAGASLRATCHPGYWRCIDPTIPLAEATTDANGTFLLGVPDPATR